MPISSVRLIAICTAALAMGVGSATVSSVHAAADNSVNSPANSAANNPASDPMAAENVRRGETLYTSSCAFCHGATAKGSSTGPSLIDSALVRHDKDGDLIGEVVREGRVAKGMPPFPIYSSAEISDIVAYLHARVATTDSRETAGPRSGYQLKQLLSGDAEAGKAYFNGAGGCSRCHSVTGDLAKIAIKYQPTELEGKILYPRGKSSTAVVTLKDGTTVQGTLLHDDPFYVAVLDSQGVYHSWERRSIKMEVNDPLKQHLNLLGKYTNKDVHDLFAYLETIK